jgi:hypothetical protein
VREVEPASEKPTCDNLDLKWLVQTMATEEMASERIEEGGQRGRYQCCDATARAAGLRAEEIEEAPEEG